MKQHYELRERSEIANTEHIALLKAHLNKLLEIAEKRTPGEWRVESRYTNDQSAACISAGINREGDEPDSYAINSIREGCLSRENADFVTSCAGNAERGWRSTPDHLYECDEQLNYAEVNFDADNIRHWRGRIEKILAEWPIETLK